MFLDAGGDTLTHNFLIYELHLDHGQTNYTDFNNNNNKYLKDYTRGQVYRTLHETRIKIYRLLVFKKKVRRFGILLFVVYLPCHEDEKKIMIIKETTNCFFPLF